MKVLILDTDGEGMGVDIAMRIQEAEHETKYWLPPHRDGTSLPYGDGLLNRPAEWEPEMDWADLIVLTGNSTYQSSLVEYFGRGYPIFGANPKSAELELDRGVGQSVLEYHGIDTLPFEVVDSAEDAIRHIAESGKAYVLKPWGGDADKAMTLVSRSAEDAIFTIQRWVEQGKFKGQLMLQEKVDGIEMGISGFFGPGGWASAIEESFEHKKFLNDDLGENTGEMGTVIRHVEKSKLFAAMLEPLTEYLHRCNYVGDCAVNCIIDEEGKPWPLEFTMRLGWPDFCIRQSLIESDPAEWMFDLVHGKDTLKVSPDIAVGVLMAHGDFPKGKDPMNTWSGYPISGISSGSRASLHFQQVMVGEAPVLKDGKVERVSKILTAGNYVLVASGTARTVSRAADRAYETAWGVKWPSNIMFRTDIGKRLEEELPLLQAMGFAKGMRY